MNTDGWIKLHRKLRETPKMNNPNYRAVWTEILMEAEHGKKKVGKEWVDKTEDELPKRQWNGETIRLKPGQLTIGSKQLAIWTGVPESTSRRVMQWLASERMIERQVSGKFSLIQVINWQEYQVGERLDDHEVSAERARDGDNIKKLRNKELEKEEYNPPTSLAVGSSDFQDFIKKFNELTGRQYVALPKYQAQYKARLKLYTPDQILQAVTSASKDSFLRGANDKGTDYLTVEYILRNDAQIDKYLNFEQKSGGGKKYAIKINGIEKEVTKAEYDAYRARNNPNL